jgi:hypothetical protein
MICTVVDFIQNITIVDKELLAYSRIKLEIE